MSFLLFVFYFLLFIFGLCVGSFLNAVIWRLEKNKSIIFGRSHCPYCRKFLEWYDLIPVLSFLFLRGRCRYCDEKISWQYPLVEIATGVLFVAVANFQFSIFNKFSITNYQLPISLLFWLYLASVLIVIFVYDLKHFIIPDKIVFPAIAISIGYHVLNIMYAQNYVLYVIRDALYNYFGSALLVSVLFLALVLVSRGKWMGMGDVKLAFLMGLILGWPDILIALFLASVLGAIVGLAMIFSGKKTLKSQVPFGPFLAAGTFIALFWGGQLLNWCFNFPFILWG